MANLNGLEKIEAWISTSTKKFRHGDKKFHHNNNELRHSDSKFNNNNNSHWDKPR